MMEKNWGSLEVMTQLSTSLLELHLSKTGELTLEAGKCAQPDESLIPSFYIITIEAVYGQVFVFLNLQCVNFASSMPFIMCYLYCVASTKSTKPRLHVQIHVLSC